MREKIVFERQSIGTVMKKMILPGVILLVLLSGFFVWSRISTDAHHILQEARDIRVALRLVGLEYRSTDRSVYDPSAPYGLAAGAEKKLRELTFAEGEISLTGWDELSGMPLSFTYRKGAYLVEYRTLDRKNTTNGEWEIFYSFHILTYTTDRN